MAQKWKLQDIRPPERESRPTRKTGVHQGAKQTRTTNNLTRGTNSYGSQRVRGNQPRKRRKVLLILVAIGVLLVIGFGITFLLRSAEVTVYPKFRDVTVEATFTSSQEPQVADLGHELLVLEEIETFEVPASGQEEVEERATGSITVFNEFSTSPQRLIRNTRFESPEGLIFRIADSIVVPGYTEGDDGTIIPGSITAEVFADGTGEAYNIEPARFSIPGLRGSDQFESMYATSEQAFDGGFEGLTFVIDDAVLQAAQESVHASLREQLRTRLLQERPAGFELFDEAIAFEFDSLSSSEGSGNTVTIEERAQLIVPIFKDEELARYIAQNTIVGYEDEPVRIEDSSLLTFAYPQATTSEPLTDISEMTFNLRGNITLVWVFDTEELQNDLAGLSKTALPSVLSGYPAILRAEAVIRPFWKQSFPEEVSQIEIIEVLEE